MLSKGQIKIIDEFDEDIANMADEIENLRDELGDLKEEIDKLENIEK